MACEEPATAAFMYNLVLTQAEWISQNSGFPTKRAIVRFGMQECESYVSSNIVFRYSRLVGSREWGFVRGGRAFDDT